MLEVDCGSGRRWFENTTWEVRCLACYSTMKFSFSELSWVDDRGRVTLYIYCPCCGTLHVSYEEETGSDVFDGEFPHFRRTGDAALYGLNRIWINTSDRKAFTMAFPERGSRR